jgi:hypothetical protein
MKKIICLFVFITNIVIAKAQIDVPVPSPASTVIQKFGLTEIKLEYSRPSVNGRKIFGNVVPFDSIWRTGANDPTTFTTKDSLTINGKGLAKGTYIILTRPGKTTWEIIFNKNPLVSYTNYKPQDDVLRISVPVNKTDNSVETFLISTTDIKSNSCNLVFEWENSIVKLQLVNDVHTKVMNQIKQKLAGLTQSEYTTMARFYFENGEDINQALTFINKAVEMGEGYGNLRLKSLILAKSGDKKQAVVTAKKSLERAIASNNQDYIRMNKESIAEWEK